MAKLKIFSMGLSILLTIILSQSVTAQGSAVYFPLNISNEWTYRYSSHNTMTETIVDTQRVEGILYYKFDHFRWQPEVWFGRSGEQVFRYIDTAAYLWYDFSADTGQSWIAHESEDVEFTVTLLSKTETITTPAGTFDNCYHFYFAGIIDNEWEEWFAPGAGIVKRVLHGFAFFEWELIDNIITDLPDTSTPQLSETFELYQNYPNPFNPATTIEYYLPSSAEVIIKVYNLLGQEVRTLVSEFHSPGTHSVEWDGRSDLGYTTGSGVYFYRMEAGSFIETRRLVLLR
jgi:hypothetical protein